MEVETNKPAKVETNKPAKVETDTLEKDTLEKVEIDTLEKVETDEIEIDTLEKVETEIEKELRESDIKLCVNITWDNLSKDFVAEVGNSEYDKRMKFLHDNFSDRSVIIWRKICDFCKKELPMEWETLECIKCNKTYDICLDCPNHLDQDKLLFCFRDECRK